MSRIGTVLKIKRKEVLVMTNQSDFVMINKKSGMFVGQRIHFEESDIRRPAKTVTRTVFGAMGVAAVILVSFLTFIHFLPPLQSQKAYAFIDIDINPSLELVINQGNSVIEARALNEEARTLLAEVQIKNKDAKEAISAIVQKSKEAGYIHKEEENIVLITASLNTDKKDLGNDQLDGLLTAINDGIMESEKDSMLTTKIVKVTSDIRLQAAGNNVSMGRRVIIENAKTKSIEIGLNEIKNKKIPEILRKLLADRKNKAVETVGGKAHKDQKDITHIKDMNLSVQSSGQYVIKELLSSTSDSRPSKQGLPENNKPRTTESAPKKEEPASSPANHGANQTEQNIPPNSTPSGAKDSYAPMDNRAVTEKPGSSPLTAAPEKSQVTPISTPLPAAVPRPKAAAPAEAASSIESQKPSVPPDAKNEKATEPEPASGGTITPEPTKGPENTGNTDQSKSVPVPDAKPSPTEEAKTAATPEPKANSGEGAKNDAETGNKPTTKEEPKSGVTSEAQQSRTEPPKSGNTPDEPTSPDSKTNPSPKSNPDGDQR